MKVTLSFSFFYYQLNGNFMSSRLRESVMMTQRITQLTHLYGVF